MKTLAPPQAAPTMAIDDGEFVLHLEEDAADGGDARGKMLDDLGGGSYGIARGEIGACRKRPLATGAIAVQEVRPGEHACGLQWLVS